MPKNFDQDAKDRVVRLVEDRILAENVSIQKACKIVAPKLGVSWHTARQWMQQARRDGRFVERMPEDVEAENARLRRRFRVGTRPKTLEMIQFIDKYRDRFFVEFICQTLNTHRIGGFIISRGYRQHKARSINARGLRDATLVEHITKVCEENYGVYGIRKMWYILRRKGIDIGREQTARLMRLAGVSDKGKGRSL